MVTSDGRPLTPQLLTCCNDAAVADRAAINASEAASRVAGIVGRIPIPLNCSGEWKIVKRCASDLSATGARQPQQAVSQVMGLTTGNHSISIVNRGPGAVAVDAIVVRP